MPSVLSQNFPTKIFLNRNEVKKVSGQKQPVDLVLANGRKHLTKEEIEQRRSQEVKVDCDNIIAPSYLTKKQKEKFVILLY